MLKQIALVAGLVGAGFAWIEDIFYIANAETPAASLVTAALRLVMAPFAHPLFTTFTGIGVYFALKQRSAAAKFGCILLGYAVAVLLHAIWNGSALFGIGTYFGVYAFLMVPIFGLTIALAVNSRRREQRVVAERLPGMVAAGLVTANEATWLGSIETRKRALATAQNFGGKAGRRSACESCDAQRPRRRSAAKSVRRRSQSPSPATPASRLMRSHHWRGTSVWSAVWAGTWASRVNRSARRMPRRSRRSTSSTRRGTRRSCRAVPPRPFQGISDSSRCSAPRRASGWSRCPISVSYTHLTLPTIYPV